MGGASSSAAGSTGLVPAPSAGDQNKVLNGAGRWDGSLSTELASVENGLAYRETGTKASRNILDGEYVFWNGAMYKANGNIASGVTLVSGTNLTPTENALNALNSKMANIKDRFKNNYAFGSFSNLYSNYDSGLYAGFFYGDDKPESSGDYFVIQIRRDDLTGLQIAINSASVGNIIYIRTMVGGSWNSWTTF